MTVKGQRQLLFGLIKGKPRELKSGESIMVEFYGGGFGGMTWYIGKSVTIKDHDRLSVQGVADGHWHESTMYVNGEKKHTLMGQEINDARITAYPLGFLTFLFPYSQKITWEPTPEEIDPSSGRRK